MAYFKCGGGGGSSILSGTSDPSASEGANGQIYLKYVEGGLDLSGASTKIESSSTMEVTKTANSIVMDWLGSSSIGAQAWISADLTDVDELSITLTVGDSAYDSNFASWHPKFAITQSDPSDSYITSDLSAELSTANTTQTFTIDVSSYSGTYYLVMNGSGCDCSFSSIILDGETNSIITAAKLKVSGSWTDLIGSDINDVTL